MERRLQKKNDGFRKASEKNDGGVKDSDKNGGEEASEKDDDEEKGSEKDEEEEDDSEKIDDKALEKNDDEASEKIDDEEFIIKKIKIKNVTDNLSRSIFSTFKYVFLTMSGNSQDGVENVCKLCIDD